MRCKNCGSDNDDNRYICANCGSPLYDEDDYNNTKVVPNKPANAPQQSPYDQNPYDDGDDDNTPDNEKKSVIVIAILIVLLIAIVTSIVVVANAKKHNKDNETTATETTISTTAQSTTKETTTKETTTKETTTEESTTEATTTKANYSVNLYSSGGGTVECKSTGTPSANYESGSNVTIKAYPDADYSFDGWYSNGNLLSTSASYSFTISENMNISAQFSVKATADSEENFSDFD